MKFVLNFDVLKEIEGLLYQHGFNDNEIKTLFQLLNKLWNQIE